jgi:hypothetical protein
MKIALWRQGRGWGVSESSIRDSYYFSEVGVRREGEGGVSGAVGIKIANSNPTASMRKEQTLDKNMKIHFLLHNASYNSTN